MSETERKVIAESNARIRAIMEQRFRETHEPVPYLKDAITGRLSILPNEMRYAVTMVYCPDWNMATA